MEHSPLTDPETIQAVRANTLATYLGLVEPISTAVVSKPNGYTLVRGPGTFSFCNFAAGFETDDTLDTVEALANHARECPGFYVFVMTGDKPKDLGQSLEARGFALRQELISMVRDPVECKAGQQLDRVTVSDDRSHVTRFMCEQFFSRLPPEAREAIAAATAASRHQIFKIGVTKTPQAAVMLVPSTGSIGLYNLCVKPELRNQGIGKSVVESIICVAAQNGIKVVLQCESTLVPWYEKLGFKNVGLVRAFTFTGTNPGDILS